MLRNVVLLIALTLPVAACNFEHQKSTDNPQGESDATGQGQGEDEDNRTAEELWSLVEAELLTPSCITCHKASKPAAGIDLSSQMALTNLQNKYRGFLTPGNPETSRLYTVITSGRMPPGGRQVQASGLEALAAWIRVLGKDSSNTPQPVDPTPSPSIRPSPTLSPTPVPTSEPTPTPTPTIDPSVEPTVEPTVQPSPTPTLSPIPTWIDVRDQLLIPYQCVSCHEGEFASASVDLSDKQKCRDSMAFGEPSMPVVVPGNPAASRLYQVLVNGSMPPEGVEPLPGMPLHPGAHLKQLVEQWLLNGAN